MYLFITQYDIVSAITPALLVDHGHAYRRAAHSVFQAFCSRRNIAIAAFA